MGVERMFRSIFWILAAVVFVFNRIIPSLRAKRSGEELLPDAKAVRTEGRLMFFLRVTFFFLFLAFLVLYSLDPPFMKFLHLDVPLWLRWSGTVVAFLGMLLWIYSQAVLGRHWSPQLQLQSEHRLVTTGPYRFVRHPIYAGMILWAVGLAVLTANLAFALLALLTILGLLARIPKEERMLAAHFGDTYRDYSRKTGRLFPGL